MMNKINTEEPVIDKLVKTIIAEQIGVEVDDIHMNDRLDEELHMRPSDISDLLLKLESEDLDIKEIDVTEISTVEELVTLLDSPDI